MQKRSSKATSVNSGKLPAIYNKLNVSLIDHRRILDYGCGKYFDNIKFWGECCGIECFGYDKYNQSDKDNYEALQCSPSILICSNVLNVIDDDESVNDIHNTIRSFNKPYFITVYEGNCSGIGESPKTKPDNWQRNQKTKTYCYDDEIVYKNVITKSEYKYLIK